MRYLKSSATTRPRRFVNQRRVEIGRCLGASDQRLYDLILAGVIGWQWPQYYMRPETMHACINEILDATEDEVLPWQM